MPKRNGLSCMHFNCRNVLVHVNIHILRILKLTLGILGVDSLGLDSVTIYIVAWEVIFLPKFLPTCIQQNHHIAFTGRKANFLDSQYRAQFPVHFPSPVLKYFRKGEGNCTENSALYFCRKHEIPQERCTILGMYCSRKLRFLFSVCTHNFHPCSIQIKDQLILSSQPSKNPSGVSVARISLLHLGMVAT